MENNKAINSNLVNNNTSFKKVFYPPMSYGACMYVYQSYISHKENILRAIELGSALLSALVVIITTISMYNLINKIILEIFVLIINSLIVIKPVVSKYILPDLKKKEINEYLNKLNENQELVSSGPNLPDKFIVKYIKSYKEVIEI